ncbi:MAG: class I SAM-dependent methyltransferase [Xanthomonadales bacterium]|nr:class I SAM-dependent methyltransferase [Xanthomonadales bacterium]
MSVVFLKNKILGFAKHVLHRTKGLIFLKSSRQHQFSKIFRAGGFGASPSLSGSGSDLKQTEAIRAQLPELLREHNIKSMLDAPCGDWYWMQHVDLTGVRYTGADIVPELIDLNRQKFGNSSCEFISLDIVKDTIPSVDLVFCRDCLVHLSLKDAREALRNIASSESKFLLTTTFTSRTVNDELGIIFFRPLNLQKPPFNLPEPFEIISRHVPKTAVDSPTSR